MTTTPTEQTADLAGSLDRMAIALNIKTELGKAAFHQAIFNVRHLDQKQQDYGPDNLTEFGETGIMVRLSDKRSRLKNLLKLGGEPKNESIADSWLDLSNYALIAQVMRLGLWPSKS